MKKLFILSILFTITAVAFSQRISELPPASTLNPADLIPIVQGGVTKKVTAGEIVQLIQDSLSNVRILSDSCLEINYQGALDTICFSGDPGLWIADGDDIENTNAGDITFNGQLYAPDIAAVPGAKFHEVVGFAANKRLFPKSIIDLYYDTMDSLDKMTSPIPYAIWRRDTTHHRVQLVHPEDTVIVSTISSNTVIVHDTILYDQTFTATSTPWALSTVHNDPNSTCISTIYSNIYPNAFIGDTLRIWFEDDLSNYGYLDYVITDTTQFADSIIYDYDDLVIASPCPCTFDSVRIWGTHIYTTDYGATKIHLWDDEQFFITLNTDNRDLLRIQTNFPENTFLGNYAGQFSTCNYSIGIGTKSLWYSTCIYSTALGNDALNYNTGDNSTAVGWQAGKSNIGAYGTFFGWNSGNSNEGTNVTAIGASSASLNTGLNGVGVGYCSLQRNSGTNVTGIGDYSLVLNRGFWANGVGYQSLYLNTGYKAYGVGDYSLNQNNGYDCIGIGIYTLNYNEGDSNIAVGNESFNSWHANSSKAKYFNYDDIHLYNGDEYHDTIHIPSHDFGANGTYVNLIYYDGTDPIVPLYGGLIYTFQIINDSTITLISTRIIDPGTGTNHQLIPQYVYNNSTAIGYNAEPTKSNQIVLGNTSTVETLLYGSLKLTPQSNAPSPAEEGLIYYDLDDHKLKVYNGSIWENLN